MKKILIALLILSLSLMTFTSCDDTPNEEGPVVRPASVWDGETVTTDWYTLTPEAKEFELNSASDLAGLAELVNGTEPIDFAGKKIKLNIDIDLKNFEWTPIGQKEGNGKDNPKNFSGEFDGDGHIIHNLSIRGDLDAKFDGYAALFGAADGTVKNLTVDGNVESENAAGIVARANAKCVIENCVNNVNVTGGTKAGGIACLSNPTSAEQQVIVRNCVNNGTVKTGNDGLGGILGLMNKYTVIENCINNGNIGTTSDKYVGGIIGYGQAPNSASIKNSTNNGKIEASHNAGGIAGLITGATEQVDFDSNKNYGVINAGQSSNSYSAAGGIIGGSQAKLYIKDCSNFGNVSCVDRAAGIVGSLNGETKIENPVVAENIVITALNDNFTENGSSVPEGKIEAAIVGTIRENNLTIINAKDFGNYELVDNLYSNGKGDTVTLQNCVANNKMDWAMNTGSAKLVLDNTKLEEMCCLKDTLVIEGKNEASVNILSVGETEDGKLAGAINYKGFTPTKVDPKFANNIKEIQ